MIDIMLLKAAHDACTPDRLERAREIANDPEAARRALVEMPSDRAAPPHDYLDAILTVPPQDTVGSGAAAAWFDGRARRLTDADDEPEGRGAVAAAAGVHPDESLGELLPDERLAGYDALSPTVRDTWDDAFRRIAADWLDAAAAEFGEANHLPRAGGWGQEAVAYGTVDGGQLLICAADDNGVYEGVCSWFESALFVLAEVAAAAGFHEPTRLDVE